MPFKGKPFLVACIVLASISSALSVDVCGTPSLTGQLAGVTVSTTTVTVADPDSGSNTYSCTCPTGTGDIVGLSSTTLPDPAAFTGANRGGTTAAVYVISAGTATVASTVTVTAASTISNSVVITANYVLSLCTDILPGYAYAAGAAAITTFPTSVPACTAANTFCPGDENYFTFTTNAFNSVTPTATAWASTAAWITGATDAATPASDDSDISVPCPPTTAAATAGSSLSACLVNNGYRISTAFTVSTRIISGTFAVTQCTAGNTCATGDSAISATRAAVACTGGSNSGAGSFICPVGTSGTMGASIAASLTALTGEVVCGGGYQADTSAVNCIASVGYYGASVTSGTGTPSTTVNATACPTGLTTDSTSASGVGLTALAGCTDLAAGYAFAPSISATNSLSGLVLACAKNNYGCAGVAGVFKVTQAAVNGLTFVGSTLLTSTSGYAGTITTAATGTYMKGTCPPGVTTASATNAGANLAACSDLAVGWAFNPSLAATTNITALLTQCTAGNYGCAGKASVFVNTIATTDSTGVFGTTGIASGTTTTANTVLSSVTVVSSAISTAAANAGANILGTCPAFATNTFTATSSTTWAATAATAIRDCTDLAPGYGFAPTITSATTVSTLLESCLPGYYGPVCAGSPGLFKSGLPVAAVTNTSLTGTVTYQSGLNSDFATGELVLASPTDFVAGGFGTLAAGALIISQCPAGSTNAGGAAMLLISSCIVKPGYYVDHSDLNCASGSGTCAVCPAGEYCTGGGAVGTVGGDTVCPIGTVGPATSSILNSNINDCVLSAGFYTTSTAVNTAVPCLSGFICAGGAALGTVGGAGSVQCPTGSTNAACITPAGPANTTVNSAPVTVSSPVTVTPTPVTVAAPAITVTPAPITVTPAAITVTPAPITVNVPAPVSAASTGSSALVLVLAALAALAAF